MSEKDRNLSPSKGWEKQVSEGAGGANSDVPAPGQIVAGKYQVDYVLGAGGMGVVLAAHHLQLPQRVAIKFMRAEAARDGNSVERFLREGRAAVALSSEHVTRVLDVGTLDSGAPYMVMEFMDGVDLGGVLEQRGAMPVAEAVGYVLQACEAIAEAHSLGMVHRDLKPSNLFLNKRRDGTTIVKVLDFGISKVTDFHATAGADLTASGLVLGSPGYMSPEQVRSAKNVDARSDLWALGVILFELLTGVRPFAGETLGEMLALILSETPPTVRHYRAEIPEGLSAVIASCLERRIDRRVQNVGELAAKLVSFGPPDAKMSLDRILRWRTARSAESFSDNTQTAVAAAAAPMETGSPWLRSESSAKPAPRSPRAPWVVLTTAGVAVIVGLGAYALRDHTRSSDSPRASAPSSPTAVASQAVTAADSAAVLPQLPQEVSLPIPSDAGQSVVPSPPPSTTSVPLKQHVPRPTVLHPPSSVKATPSTSTPNEDVY